MKVKTYEAMEFANVKTVDRKVKFESRVHDGGESELLIQIKDNGEFNETISCLIVDKIDMKRLRQILNHCIGRE